MNKYGTRILQVSLCFALVFMIIVLIQQWAAPDVKAATIVSRLVKNSDGKVYLEVDGKPFLQGHVQISGTRSLKSRGFWTSPYPTPMPLSFMENFFEKTAAVNYNTISIIFNWLDIEHTSTPGAYDWTTIDSYIDWANEYGLRIDLTWFGSNSMGGSPIPGCGAYDNGTWYDWSWCPQVPPYLQNKSKYFGNGSRDKYQIQIPWVLGAGHDADMNYLYQQERNAVQALFAHLASYDVNHRVIMFQLQNEPNAHPNYWDGNKPWHSLMNQEAQIIKNSNYVVVTRVNMASSSPDTSLIGSSYPYIDCVGIDPYTTSVSSISSYIGGCKFGNNLAHVAENYGSASNTTSLLLTTVVNGGFYSVWELGDDWDDKYSLYGTGGIYPCYNQWTLGTIPPKTEQANDVTHLNKAMNKIGSLIASKASIYMAGFNIGTDTPTASYNAFKTVQGKEIGYKCTDSSVGMVVNDGLYYYCVGDTAGTSREFKTKVQPTSVSYGYLDGNGSWVNQGSRSYVNNGDGTYSCYYNADDCLRIDFSGAPTPTPGNNLALTATASTTSIASGYSVSAANDGNYNTFFKSASNPTFPQYVTFTWSSPQNISSVNLVSDYCQGQAPTNWDIQVSTDGSTNWTTVASSGTVAWSYNDGTRESKSVTASASNVKGVRLKINSANLTWSQYQIDEVEVYGGSGGSTPTPGPTATPTPTPASTPTPTPGASNIAGSASVSTTSIRAGDSASTANDADYYTFFKSANNPTFPQYVTFTWSSAKNINSVNLVSDYCQGQAPTNWDIQVSTDGSTNWTTVASSGTVSWAYNNSTRESKSVTAPASNVKGVRLKINSANLTWSQYQIDEIEVYGN